MNFNCDIINFKIIEDEEITQLSKQYLDSTDIVFVDKIQYKPFWFNKHMYFVKLLDGKLFKSTPIYLGEELVADIPKLRNYFQENDIKIFNTEFCCGDLESAVVSLKSKTMFDKILQGFNEYIAKEIKNSQKE